MKLSVDSENRTILVNNYWIGFPEYILKPYLIIGLRSPVIFILLEISKVISTIICPS